MSYGKRIAAVAMLGWIAVAGCGGSPELIVPGFDGATGGGSDAGPEVGAAWASGKSTTVEDVI